MPSILNSFSEPFVQPLAPPAPLLSARMAPAVAVSPKDSREFGDSAAVRNNIYDSILDVATKLEPVSNQNHTLQLVEPHYADPPRFSIADQKQALLRRKNLTRRLRGTWQLVDNVSGKVIDEKKATVANVPFFSNRGTIIRNGNEYTMSHQMRLKSGVFTRVKENGDLTAHVNIIPGKGLSHHIFLDPETGVFRIRFANSNISLTSLLRAMGASDKEIREAWGNDLSEINMRKSSPADIGKLYKKLVRFEDPDSGRSQQESVAIAMAKMELDPTVTSRTLGTPFDHVSVESILATTRKLLAISNSDNPAVLKRLGLNPAKPDNRDSLEFMTFLGPEDLFAERVARSKHILRQTLWRATAMKSIQHIKTGVMNSALDAVLLGSGLGSPAESINPAQILEQQSRVSRMGEGGIPSIDSIPLEARDVQASHLGFIDPIITPESMRAGVDLRMARNARKGRDGRIYTKVRDVSTGKMVWKTPAEVIAAITAFPGQLGKGSGRVAAMVNGRIQYVTRRSVDYEIPSMEGSMSMLSNLVPLKSAVKGQRTVMAVRMFTQALPMVDAESPLVQSGVPGEDDKSFEELYGDKMGALRAKSRGSVIKVSSDDITVKYDNGTEEIIELYNNFPYNRKTYIHQESMVQQGQRFAKGELLAKSNFVDDSGAVALGLNARVAYIPFRGLNFEDAIVISDSFAKRLSSQHMYKTSVEPDKDLDRTNKNSFRALFPGTYGKEVLETLDDDGIIKEGSVVHEGDPLVLVARERERTSNQVHRGRTPKFSNKTETWKHHAPGHVADVAKTSKGVVVTVTSTAAMQVGDKLSGRYGDKGVISEIISDDEMPMDKEGRPFEVLVNPLGIISRTNPAQMIEAALGKIAAVTGKKYKVKDFEDIEDLTEYALSELKKHGMEDLETITDPLTERKINDVFVGNRFFMKLHHTAETKGTGRSFGGYTAEGKPAKGGESGSKTVGMLDLNALLSHGATEVIRDAKMIRGQRNPEFWSAFMSGHKPPTPKIPFVYEKFISQLKASGINPVREGTKLNVMAMTEKDVLQMTGDREITKAATVHWKEGLKPIPGGLFDEKLTGGHNGNRWAYIKLPEPLPNPAMEEPVIRLLGLTKSKYMAVLAGRMELNGMTGPEAVYKSLDRINVVKEIARARQDMTSGRNTLRDAAVRKLKYLKSSRKTGIHPREWILSRVPVLPPAFRPVSILQGSGSPMVADPNYLYRDLFEASKHLSSLSEKVDDISDERIAVYQAFRAVVGLGDPITPELQDRNVKGILQSIFGSSPKYGMVQRKLLGTTTDVVGRAAITPNPELDMDQVGIPEDKAWEIYRPFVIRKLVRKGMPRLRAARSVKEREDAAREELVKVMSERPVIINRAPVIHRYGMMAAWPHLVKNDTMQISPLVVGGFNADFDGDAMQYHVPVSDAAVDEAIQKLLPSRNLFAPADFEVHYKPSQEYVGGLYSASTARDRRAPRTFADKKEAIRAYKRGEIGPGHRVVILN